MRPRFSVFIAASLDGFIARADGNIDWLSIHALDQEPNGYDEFIRTVDAIVIGRGTYETVLGFGGWFYGDKRVIRGPHCQMAVCLDSEGNSLLLHQLDAP
ncbi:MAG TPA: hypothetical protein VHT91_00250 [Kofleriaceae bacterium]|jgi:dihydrofolate reductase|nr:hypothetical protein [Kofleriaceae bacterium]